MIRGVLRNLLMEGGGSASVEPKNPLETIDFTDSEVGWAPLAPPPSYAFECKWIKKDTQVLLYSRFWSILQG